MTDPSEKDLLDWLDEQECELMEPVRLSGRPPTEYHLEKQTIIDALRRLIEKAGEWRVKMERILVSYDRDGTLSVDTIDTMRQIRDFGKEGR